MKKYIKLIKKSILEEIDETRGIEELEIRFSIDGADNPEVHLKLKTYSKI